MSAVGLVSAPRLRALLLALPVASAMGCGDAAVTEVIVIAEPRPSMLSQAPSVSWTVTNLQESAVAGSASSAKWNADGTYTLGLSPREGRAGGEYRVEVSAQRAGRTLATARLVSGYVAGETRYVTLTLDDSCTTPCDANSTCHQQRCLSARVDETRFGKARSQAPRAVDLAAASAGDAGRGDDAGTRGDAGQSDAGDGAAPRDDAGTPDGGTVAPDAASAEAGDAAVPDAGAPTPTEPAVTATIPLARGDVTLTRTDCPPDLSCSTSGLATVRDLQNRPIQFCVVRNGVLPGLMAPACRQDSDCTAIGLTSSVCNDGVFCVSYCR